MEENLDELANTLYRADMKAEGDPLIYKWEHLGEPWVSRYRAMARAVLIYQQKQVNQQNTAQKASSIQNAVQELRSLASALDTDLPGDAGYAQRLTAIADSLETLYETHA